MIGTTILTEINGSIATIWLNRPEKHNALNGEMILAFLKAIKYFNSKPDIRIIVIRGKGSSFCSGADLSWMKRSSLLSEKDNINECELLAQCYYEISINKKITICIAHGSCLGGANGFIAASDLSYSEGNSQFAFSEVKLGIVPATIFPYITRKISKNILMELMFTGRRFNAIEAKEYGFINNIIDDKVDSFLSELTNEMINASPLAQRIIKSNFIWNDICPIEESIIKESAILLANIRVSDEAREGINAFLEKRNPVWRNNYQTNL